MPRFREDSSWSLSRVAGELFHRGARPFVLKVAQTFLVIIVAIVAIIWYMRGRI